MINSGVVFHYQGGNQHVEDFSIAQKFPVKRGMINLGVLLILTQHYIYIQYSNHFISGNIHTQLEYNLILIHFLFAIFLSPLRPRCRRGASLLLGSTAGSARSVLLGGSSHESEAGYIMYHIYLYPWSLTGLFSGMRVNPLK